MQFYANGSKDGSVITNKVCNLEFHSKWLGLGVEGGKTAVGLGLAEHYDVFFRINFLFWTFEIVKEIFIDEDDLVGNDRSVV